MRTESPEGMPPAATLDAILRELRCLSERVAALEADASRRERAPAPPAPVLAEDELSDELIMVIGAAVAAYLGKAAHVRQVRLISSAPWAQQGRVIIQASHTLGGRSGREQS